MRKTFKYRLYPTKKQERVMNEQLALCAELYNAALQERKEAYRLCGKSITLTQQCAQLSAIKAIRPEYEAIYSQVLQDVLNRVDKAFKAFFSRVKAGHQPGYPRYKSRSRYASLTYPQKGFGIDDQGKLFLSKIGHLRMVQHRPTRGIVKTCSIVRTPTGKWFVCFSCDEVEPQVLPPSNEQVGIDVGLKTFAFLSTGEQIAIPRFFRKEAKQMSKAQRRLSKVEQNNPVRRKRRKVVARVNERIRWRRENFVKQVSSKLVKRFGLIAIESLIVRNLIKRPRPKQDEATGQYMPNGASSKTGLNTSIADAAWSTFFNALVAKAEEAGRQVVRVPPAYTTQTCINCGHQHLMPLSVRIYTCERCGMVRDRDHNASLNILHTALGRQSVALGA
jgi:putative transposase